VNIIVTTGADEQIVAIHPSGSIRVLNVAELADQILNDDDDEVPALT
jgi:hypothetical protein